MTVAIKSNSDGVVIWFAAVLKYNTKFSANVSKHPVEFGVNISDNTTTENPVYTISGIVSDVDHNQMFPYVIPDALKEDGTMKEDVYQNKRMFFGDTPSTVQILEGRNKFQKYLPESVGQFFNTKAPTVEVSEGQRIPVVDNVRNMLEKKWRAKEVFSVLEYKTFEESVDRVVKNCIMTSLDFEEDAESGDGLYANMTFEQVSVANSKKVFIGKQVDPKFKNAASATAANKGAQPSEAVAGTKPSEKAKRDNKNASALKVTKDGEKK